MQGDHFAEAVSYFKRALASDPRNTEIVMVLRDVYLWNRRYPEAETLAKQAMELEPDNSDYAYILAVTPFNARGSTREMELWLKSQPEASRVIPLEWLYIIGDAAGCVKEFERHHSKPTNDWIQDWQETIWYAQALTILGQKEQARNVLAPLQQYCLTKLSGEPGNYRTKFILGLAYATIGETQHALATAEEAFAQVPDNVSKGTDLTNRQFAATIYGWTGELDRARAEWERLLHMTYGPSVNVLRRCFDTYPLQNDPSFKALLDDPKSNAPLF